MTAIWHGGLGAWPAVRPTMPLSVSAGRRPGQGRVRARRVEPGRVADRKIDTGGRERTGELNDASKKVKLLGVCPAF